MAYDIKNTKVIYLGRQGENLARTIEIDVSSMLMKWPDATISLLVQRNQEDTFYLAPVVIENGILKWTITNADTEIAGIGKIEVRAIQDDAIMKSATMKICVENSLGGTETDVPDPVQTWVDTIVAASVQAKQSAEDALASELAAKEAAESIAELESNIEIAEAARVEAEKERISAENERESAETSRETAENNRVAAETARVTAEQSRASAETARESAETDRQTTFETAEAGRAAAESSRVAAEESRVNAEVGRVEAESERVTAENQRAETFAGYETRIDAATPDDSAVDGKPWTSRKIVDTLCPPFDVSGSAVTCHPVERYPLDVVSRIDATQSGTGDPSPDNIRPIVGRDSVSLNRCGKNLLKYIWDRIPDTASKDGLTITKQSNGTLLVVGTKTTTTWTDIFRVHLKVNEYMTIPAGTYSWGTGISIISAKKNYHSSPATLDKQIEIRGAYCAVNVAGTYNNIYVPALVVGGLKPEKVEPYTGDTYTAELPETVYGGELDWNNGILIVDWAKFSINPSKIKKASENLYCHTVLNDNNVKPAKGGQKNAISNVMVSLNNIDNDVTGNSFSVYSNGIIRFYIDGITTLEEMVAYATENPIEIAYKLATPYTIQITPQQITALSGVNTLYTDSGDISVSGRTDMIWLTQSLIDRIAALETAAVSE